MCIYIHYIYIYVECVLYHKLHSIELSRIWFGLIKWTSKEMSSTLTGLTCVQHLIVNHCMLYYRTHMPWHVVFSPCILICIYICIHSVHIAIMIASSFSNSSIWCARRAENRQPCFLSSTRRVENLSQKLWNVSLCQNNETNSAIYSSHVPEIENLYNLMGQLKNLPRHHFYVSFLLIRLQ